VGLAYVGVTYHYDKLTVFKAQVLIYFINTELARVIVLALEGALEVW
jgi:hypothetical protein